MLRVADRATLHAQRQLQRAFFQQGLVLEQPQRWPVLANTAIGNHNGARAEIERKIEVVRSNDLGVGESVQKIDQSAPAFRIEV